MIRRSKNCRLGKQHDFNCASTGIGVYQVYHFWDSQPWAEVKMLYFKHAHTERDKKEATEATEAT